jgi:hypothetical protein
VLFVSAAVSAPHEQRGAFSERSDQPPVAAMDRLQRTPEFERNYHASATGLDLLLSEHSVSLCHLTIPLQCSNLGCGFGNRQPLVAICVSSNHLLFEQRLLIKPNQLDVVRFHLLRKLPVLHQPAGAVRIDFFLLGVLVLAGRI